MSLPTTTNQSLQVSVGGTPHYAKEIHAPGYGQARGVLVNTAGTWRIGWVRPPGSVANGSITVSDTGTWANGGFSLRRVLRVTGTWDLPAFAAAYPTFHSAWVKFTIIDQNSGDPVPYSGDARDTWFQSLSLTSGYQDLDIPDNVQYNVEMRVFLFHEFTYGSTTARAGDESASAGVEALVRNHDGPVSMTVSPSGARTLAGTSTEDLTVEVKDFSFANMSSFPTIVWSSSNPTVATVTPLTAATARVTAQGTNGNATITAVMGESGDPDQIIRNVSYSVTASALAPTAIQVADSSGNVVTALSAPNGGSATYYLRAYASGGVLIDPSWLSWSVIPQAGSTVADVTVTGDRLDILSVGGPGSGDTFNIDATTSAGTTSDEIDFTVT